MVTLARSMADYDWSPSYNQDGQNLRWWPLSWTVLFVSSLHSKKTETVFLIKCVVDWSLSLAN